VYDIRRFFFRDDGCYGKTTLGVTAELHYEQSVDVYVGMPCSAGRRITLNKHVTLYKSEDYNDLLQLVRLSLIMGHSKSINQKVNL